MVRALLLAVMLMTVPWRAEGAQAGAAEAKPVAPPAGASDTRGYRLVAGDQIHVEVFSEPELSCSSRITAHGSFSMPLIGEVVTIDKRVEDLATEIQHRLEDGYVRHAPVTVTVIEFVPRFAYVMGNVTHQGPVVLDPFVETTALQAIGKAGGLLPDANRAATQVVRDDPDRPGQKLRMPVLSGNAPDYLTKDVELRPGDLVIVPQLDRIFVTGRVKTGGALNLTGIDHITMSKAISLAGGFDTYAKQTQVQLIRDGEAILIVDVQALLNGQRGNDPVLQPGDTVVVPESRF
jgi:polysaccharide export outer membrane protein